MEIYKQSTNSHVQKSETWIFNKQIRYDLGWSHLINPRDSYHVIILTYTGSITWDKPDKSVIIINITISVVAPYLDFLSCGTFIVRINRFPHSTLKCYFDPFLYLAKPSFVTELYVSGRKRFLFLMFSAPLSMVVFSGLQIYEQNVHCIGWFAGSSELQILQSVRFAGHTWTKTYWSFLDLSSPSIVYSCFFSWSSQIWTRRPLYRLCSHGPQDHAISENDIFILLEVLEIPHFSSRNSLFASSILSHRYLKTENSLIILFFCVLPVILIRSSNRCRFTITKHHEKMSSILTDASSCLQIF